MATERIEIINYKGIKKLDLEVRPFTVLIGPQSVGKSTTAKLLYFFKNIAREAFTAAMADNGVSLEDHLIGYFRKLLPPPTHATGKSAIHYSVGNYVFSLSSIGDGGSAWRIEIPEVLQNVFAEMKNEWLRETKQTGTRDSRHKSTRKRIFIQDFEGNLSPKFVGSPGFIPAGRSIYAQIDKDPISFFENATLDPFIAEFGKLLSRLKYEYLRLLPLAGEPPEIALRATELAEELLRGKYQREGPQDFIITSDGQKIPDVLWSSGQHESFPLVFFLGLLCQFSLDDKFKSLFVEEPEAHLFPASQRNMVELLALAFNANVGKLNLFVITHSPYVLSTLNVLLLAGQLGKGKLKSGDNGAVVNPLEVLAPDSFGAYYMDQHECHFIIDEETGLIDGRGIDDVSGEIAEQFDAVSSLQ